MILLNFTQEQGLNPRFVAHTEGGEYHSPCPSCGGTDRFVIQPNKQMKNCLGSYFCRRCGVKGDSIQFCRDYLGLSFKEAVDRVGTKMPESSSYIAVQKKINSALVPIKDVSDTWQQQARKIVTEAHEDILSQKDALFFLDNRGLPVDAIKQYQIGYIAKDKKMDGCLWGLEKESICFPVGILIPTIEKNQVVTRLKIRCEGYQSDGRKAKYIAVPGNMGGLNIIGNKKNSVIVVVESELDAYALHYAVGDFAVIVAVGGCVKNLDNVTDHIAKSKSALLICHDNDEAGKNMFDKWQKLYSHAKAYPTSIGKDIGEAVALGLNLRDWVIAALTPEEKCGLNLISYSWSEADQILVDIVLRYINELTPERWSPFYLKLKQEINLGPNSPRAKTGELQRGLNMIKQAIEDAYNNK